MSDLYHKIDLSLRQEPDYRRLEANLSRDVRERIGRRRDIEENGFPIPASVKLAALALCLLAAVALSRVAAGERRHPPDLFDMSYFSYRAAPSLDLAAHNH